MISFGSILVGIAVAGVLVMYVARPFRKQSMDYDKVIEAWVNNMQDEQDVAQTSTPIMQTPPPPLRTEAQVTQMHKSTPHASPTPPPASIAASGTDRPINFCPNCGQRVQPNHRFCPSCGNQLREYVEQ